MLETITFRTGWAKRALGWLVIIGSSAALFALIYATATHWEAQTATELLSGALIALFIAAFLFAGIAIQHVRWSIDGETIVLHHLLRSKRYPIAGLAGFGQTIIVAGLFPVAHVDLYDRDLKPVTRLPIGLKDWPLAEAQLSRRLRRVVDDGSPALPRRRFVDPPAA